MKVDDVSTMLPFAGDLFGLVGPKTSLTFHWNGGLAGDDPFPQLVADANLHIGKGWGGISYHKAIGQDGTVYICRNPNAVVAAVADLDGNAHSEMVQLMIGRNDAGSVIQHPSPQMWAAAAELARAAVAQGRDIHGHRDWSSTECPGAEVYAWIATKGWEEEEMTPAQEAKLDRVLAIMEAREPLVWTARQQRGLDVETGKPFDNRAAPADPRIKQ